MCRVCFWAWLALGVSAANGDDCVDRYDSAKDYFPDKTELQYAESFAIEYFGNYKLVTVHTPWPGAERGRPVLCSSNAALPPPKGMRTFSASLCPSVVSRLYRLRNCRTSNCWTLSKI